MAKSKKVADATQEGFESEQEHQGKPTNPKMKASSTLGRLVMRILKNSDEWTSILENVRDIMRNDSRGVFAAVEYATEVAPPPSVAGKKYTPEYYVEKAKMNEKLKELQAKYAKPE